MPKPNRLIKLFQQKADNAMGEYLLIKDKIRQSPAELVFDAQLAYLRGKLEAWQAAAELLRKEEINR